MDERKAFEDWFVRTSGERKDSWFKLGSDGGYYYHDVRTAWEVWQARASLSRS